MHFYFQGNYHGVRRNLDHHLMTTVWRRRLYFIINDIVYLDSSSHRLCIKLSNTWRATYSWDPRDGYHTVIAIWILVIILITSIIIWQKAHGNSGNVALRTSSLSLSQTFPQGGCTCYNIMAMTMAMASMAPLTGPLLRPFTNTLRLIPHLLLPPRNHIKRIGAYCDYTSNPSAVGISIRRRKFVLFLVHMGSLCLWRHRAMVDTLGWIQISSMTCALH